MRESTFLVNRSFSHSEEGDFACARRRNAMYNSAQRTVRVVALYI